MQKFEGERDEYFVTIFAGTFAPPGRSRLVVGQRSGKV